MVCVQCMSLYLNMANAPVKIWGKFSQYALQILDFTLNMPHEILGPVAPPHPKRSGVPPPGHFIPNLCLDLSQCHIDFNLFNIMPLSIAGQHFKLILSMLETFE